MNQIKQIEVDHRKAFMRMCECMYDCIQHELGEVSDMMSLLKDMIQDFQSQAGIHRMCRDGNCVMFLDMEVIEKLVAAEIPFVVIVRKEGDVFATVSCDEINY